MASNNLLLDPFFRINTPEGSKTVTLPRLLCLLESDKVVSYPGMQRHQEEAFHVFLCYLSGAILARRGPQSNKHSKTDESFWIEEIRGLTGYPDDSPWMLIVEDPTKPAFLQPPVPDVRDFSEYKEKATTPDGLDLLQTAKNHDVKKKKDVSPHLDEWGFSLVSLQTMSGFLGQGNYGIVRMNGGFGNRPIFDLITSDSPGTRWKRDVQVLLGCRNSLLSGPWNYQQNGLVFTWIRPWNGESSLSLSDLDPFFIEISRAIRMVGEYPHLRILGTSTKFPRIYSKDLKGLVGDPWIPVNRENDSALTISKSGLTPERLRNILFEDGFQMPPMLKPLASEKSSPLFLQAAVLVRGRGKTEGFHEIQVPIPVRALPLIFGNIPERDHFAKLSKTMINDSGVILNKVLKVAIFALLEGGPEKIDFEKKEVNSWWEKTAQLFTEKWQTDYFAWLWKLSDTNDDYVDRRYKWLEFNKKIALEVLEMAIARSPLRRARIFRSRVQAESIFYSSLHHYFPELRKETYGQSTSA